MLYALIATYAAGMLCMLLLIHVAKDGKARKSTATFALLFWPLVVVACYIIAGIQIINKKWKAKND